jgi:hypothetical protein
MGELSHRVQVRRPSGREAVKRVESSRVPVLYDSGVQAEWRSGRRPTVSIDGRTVFLEMQEDRIQNSRQNVATWAAPNIFYNPRRAPARRGRRLMVKGERPDDLFLGDGDLLGRRHGAPRRLIPGARPAITSRRAQIRRPRWGADVEAEPGPAHESRLSKVVPTRWREQLLTDWTLEA